MLANVGIIILLFLAIIVVSGYAMVLIKRNADLKRILKNQTTKKPLS